MTHYNASSNAFEREGYEPVPKEVILGYILPYVTPNLLSTLGVTGHDNDNNEYPSRETFIKRVYLGSGRFDERTIKMFVRLCMTSGIGLLLSLLFLFIENYPGKENREKIRRMRSNIDLKSSDIFCNPNISDEDRCTFLKWYFMLSDTMEAGYHKFQRKNATTDLIFDVHRRSAVKTEAYVQTLKNSPKLWTTIFDFAQVTNSYNDGRLIVAIEWQCRSLKLMAMQEKWPWDAEKNYNDLKEFIQDALSRYLFGFTLFERLVGLVMYPET